MTHVRRVLITLARRAGVSVRHRVGRASEFPEARDFAYCTDEHGMPPTIVTAPKLERQRPERIIGVLAHEISHAFYLSLGQPHSECTADRMAERLTGVQIGYDEADVQSITTRRRRPRYLPA
jgi:hypothetical protein